MATILRTYTATALWTLWAVRERPHTGTAAVLAVTLTGRLISSSFSSPTPRGSSVGLGCDGEAVAPPAGGARRPARRARGRRGRTALGGVLLVELPHRGERRAPGHVAGRHQQLPQRRRHPPPLLPRLLRQWLRRLAAPGRHAHDARREERRPQRRRLHLRLRPHRRHQDAGRGRLPRHRLLRRHPRPRRPRRRQPARRAELGGAAGAAGRDVPQRHGRRDGPPRPGHGPRRPGGRVRRQGPQLAGPRRAVGRAHGGDGALRQLPDARLLRRQREPGVRRAAAPGMPGVRRRRRARAARRAHPGPVRQRILPQPHDRRRPPALRPGALQQRRARPARPPLRHQRRRLLVGLRRVHDQPRQHHSAHGYRGGDQDQLQDCQFVISFQRNPNFTLRVN